MNQINVEDEALTTLVTHLTRINNTLIDIMGELTNINEGLRWSQEYAKTQAQDIQEALAARQSEAIAWQRNPHFEEEVEKRFDMEVKRRIYEATRLAAHEALTAYITQLREKRSDAAKRGAEVRKQRASNR